MNPFSRIFRRSQNKINSDFEPVPLSKSGISALFYGGLATASGKAVTEQNALQLTTVYACVRILAETIASLPLHTYKTTPEGREKANGHPLYRILHDEPNLDMTSFVFRETMMGHLLIWGNAYAQIIRDGAARVKSLHLLPPDKMAVSRDKKGELVYTLNPQGDPTVFRREEILHIPGLGFDGLIGYSPIEMARNALGMAMAAEEYGAAFFGSGATPGGVLEHPATVKDPKKLKEEWNAAHRGSGKAHGMVVLEEGLKYHPITIPPEQAQFLQTRKYQTEEICRIFRVPPHLVADLERATFSNIEHQSISFVVHTIRPWLVRIEQAMNKALLLTSEKADYFTGFVVDGLLRGAYESRMKGYSIGIQNGFMTPNECRSLENWNAVPDGDKLMVNGNMLPLEMVGAYIKSRGGSIQEL